MHLNDLEMRAPWLRARIASLEDPSSDPRTYTGKFMKTRNSCSK